MNRSLTLGALVVIALLLGCSPNADQAPRQTPAKDPAAPALSAAIPSQAYQNEVRQEADRQAVLPAAPPLSTPVSTRGAADKVAAEAMPVAAPPLPASRALDALRAASEPTDREQYAHQEDNPVKRAAEQPVSTFSIDVDTGAYANVRRFLNNGRLPPRDAVRVEELINYFDYDYPLPDSRQPPFRVSTELAPTPWNPQTLLLAIGIKGYDVPKAQLPPVSLVFLIDVSVLFV